MIANRDEVWQTKPAALGLRSAAGLITQLVVVDRGLVVDGTIQLADGIPQSAEVIKTLLGGIGVQLVEVFPEVQLLITAGLQEPIGRPNRPATRIGERVCAHKLQPFRL
jgi:hypothetical protein